MKYLDNGKLDEYEQLGCEGTSQLHLAVSNLCMEVRHLVHQLEDPNYHYAGGRVTRLSIISRNKEIGRLQDEVKRPRETKSE